MAQVIFHIKIKVQKRLINSTDTGKSHDNDNMSEFHSYYVFSYYIERTFLTVTNSNVVPTQYDFRCTIFCIAVMRIQMKNMINYHKTNVSMLNGLKISFIF